MDKKLFTDIKSYMDYRLERFYFLCWSFVIHLINNIISQELQITCESSDEFTPPTLALSLTNSLIPLLDRRKKNGCRKWSSSDKLLVFLHTISQCLHFGSLGRVCSLVSPLPVCICHPFSIPPHIRNPMQEYKLESKKRELCSSSMLLNKLSFHSSWQCKIAWRLKMSAWLWFQIFNTYEALHPYESIT